MHPGDEELLDASWILAFDEDGNDFALAARTTALTTEALARAGDVMAVNGSARR